MTRPVHDALGEVSAIVDRLHGGAPVTTVDGLLAAVRQFEQIHFDVPTGTDSDGFLFQYGTADWFPDPAFLVGVTRQLEIVDEDGEHEQYVQIAMDFRTPPRRVRPDVGERHSWWFRSDDTSFGTWLDAVRDDPVWSTIDGSLGALHVAQDVV